jgi:hypothetical protein
MRTFLSLIITFVILTSCASESTELALRLEKGKEYRQTTNSEMTIIQDIFGQKMDMKMTMSGTMTFLVKEITDQGYIMDTKFESISMAMQMPQGSMTANSEIDDPNDIFSAMMRAITGKSFEILMTKTGKVTEVNNIESLWGDALSEFDEVPEMQREQIKEQILKAYGAKALKGNIEMVTSIYPDKPVSKGEKWTVNTELESGMSGNVTTDYEFKELTSDYALIKGESIVTTADKDAYVEANGMPMRYDLSGTMTSEIKVDKNTGWIIEAKINQEIKGDTHIKENPQMPEGMTIPMEMRNKMLITN